MLKSRIVGTLLRRTGALTTRGIGTTAEDGNSRLSKDTANNLVLKLTDDERHVLMTSLREYEARQMKELYKGQLAQFRWRSKFGRPSKVASLGDVDPTGSYCKVPEDWLLKKCAESVPKPNTSELMAVGIHNAIPFVGFGFLDNFIMIVCGDYIELTLGGMMVMSTMAAAALGNTVSDVMGIGSAWYVEQVAARVGMKPPALSPIQLDMFSSRLSANLGRVFGVTIGCLLGMFPLLFLKLQSAKDESAENTDSSSSESEDITGEAEKIEEVVVETSSSNSSSDGG